MWSAPVVILLPSFKYFSGVAQRAKQRFIEAFSSQLAVEAFDEPVLLWLAWRDVVPIDARFLNPFEDGHTGELSADTDDRSTCNTLHARRWLDPRRFFIPSLGKILAFGGLVPDRVTEVVGTERVLTRGKWRTVEVLACPVTWRPHPEQIASARRGYEDWWKALRWVRVGLISGEMLREVEVTAAMPKARPWEHPRATG